MRSQGIARIVIRTLLAGLALAAAACAPGGAGTAPEPKKPVAAPQQRSPMVEHTREHRRVKDEAPEGKREKLVGGALFVPARLATADEMPLLVHFHGSTRVAEVAAAAVPSAVVTVQLGSGSSAYGKPFADPEAFTQVIEAAEKVAKARFPTVTLSAWSAGYGAVRAILRDPDHYRRVRALVLLDALHAGYAEEPGEGEPVLVADDLGVFVRFARDATEGKKEMVLTHTEVFPGTFASTTETADHLLRTLKVKRKPTLVWGPVGTQQLSEVHQGDFRLLGYAGNSAPDHVDQLHALPELLGLLRGRGR